MIITYIVRRAAVAPGRLGTEQAITLKPYTFPRPRVKERVTTAVTEDQSASRSTYRTPVITLDVEFHQIPEAQLPYLGEFLRSAASREFIEINTEGWDGHPAAYDTAILTTPEVQEFRLGHQFYGVKLSFQILGQG